VVASDLPRDLGARLPDAETLLDPAGYLGEAEDIVDTAIAAWTGRRGTA
jgi:hypothetical protein